MNKIKKILLASLLILVFVSIVCFVFWHSNSSAVSKESDNISDTHIENVATFSVTEGKQLNVSKSDYVFLTDYVDYVDDDWSVAIQQAEKAAVEQRKNIFINSGEYKISHYITKLSGVDWIGEGEDTIIFFDNTFNSDDSKMYDSNYIVINENAYSEDARDTFRISQLKIENRTTDDFKGNHISGFFCIYNTDDVYIDSVIWDFGCEENSGKTRIFDFKGGNSGTSIVNCYIVGVNAGITFRNFKDTVCSNITIKNNYIQRSGCASCDETLWVCANVGGIDDIEISYNTICADDVSIVSSAIFVTQDDSGQTGSHVISNVHIIDNTITIPNIKYYGIGVGSADESMPPVQNVDIQDNRIECFCCDEATFSCGIATTGCISTRVADNTVKGFFKTFILGPDSALRNVIIEEKTKYNINVRTTGLGYIKYAERNEVSVSGIGTKDCFTLVNNNIKSQTNHIYSSGTFWLENNTFEYFGDDCYCFGVFLNDIESEKGMPVIHDMNNNYIGSVDRKYLGNVEWIEN